MAGRLKILKMTKNAQRKFFMMSAFLFTVLAFILLICALSGGSSQSDTVQEVSWVIGEMPSEDLTRIVLVYVGLNVVVHDGTKLILDTCTFYYCDTCKRAGDGAEACGAVAMASVIVTLMTSVLRLYIDFAILRNISITVALGGCIFSLTSACIFSNCREAVIDSDVDVEYGPGFVCMVVTFLVMLPTCFSHAVIFEDDRIVRMIMPVEEDSECDDDNDGHIMSFDPETDDIPRSWLQSTSPQRAVYAEEIDEIPVAIPIADAQPM